jgi:flagellar L-ring protein FlgH
MRTFALAALACLIISTPVAAQSLFADPKANAVGDVITVVLAERTAAQREAGWDNQSRSRFGGDASISNGVEGRFGADARFGKEAQARNTSSQRDLLTGTFSARIVDKDARGNLLVHGERRLNVNGETHILRVSGVVRPFDIRHDNSILSYQIADAEIEYRQAGMHRRFVRPGFLARAGAVVVLGAAIFFATN